MYLTDICFRTTACMTHAADGFARMDALFDDPADADYAARMSWRLPRLAEQSGRRLRRSRRAAVYRDAIEKGPRRATRRFCDAPTEPMSPVEVLPVVQPPADRPSFRVRAPRSARQTWR